ncbi:MAG TPA: serine hydrolase [Ktedonobacterales bacterium]
MTSSEENTRQQGQEKPTYTAGTTASASAAAALTAKKSPWTTKQVVSDAPTLPSLPADFKPTTLAQSAEAIAGQLPARARTMAASAFATALEVVDHLDEVVPPMRLAPVRRPTRMQPRGLSGLAIALLLILAPALIASVVGSTPDLLAPWGGPPDRVPRGASAWAEATTITPLKRVNAEFGAQTYPIDGHFAKSYAERNGQAMLGAAVTSAFDCNLGLVQFFANGALALPKPSNDDSSTAASSENALDPALTRDGYHDAANGVVWLPLTHALLEAGSKAPIGGDTSSATYATLRNATQVIQLTPTPAQALHIKANVSLPQVVPLDEGSFVIEGSRGGKLVGHEIPASIWSFITNKQMSPNGWMQDFGEPVTDALHVTATSGGQEHHLLVQVFWQTIVLSDLDNPDNTTIQPIGVDYLRTLGAPTAHQVGGVRQWLTQDGALRTAPGESNVAVSLNTNSAVTLTGQTSWSHGLLWLGADWSTPTRNGEAWVATTALTTTAPTAPASAGFDILSPDLAKYLNSQGDSASAVVYDVTRNVQYTYNPNGLFTMASSAKVPLMVEYLQYIEGQGRGPNSYETSIMTSMIENSDNNAAEVIYDTLNYDAGERAAMQSWGINDFVSDPNGWGWGQWSAADMAHLLTLMQSGKILNASDRALAFNLMQNIESDQRFGVGDTAPANSTVAMKDGWVNEPDGAWAVNTSGVVTVGNETYIIAVYTKEQNSFGSGQDIVNHVAGAVAQALK